MPLILILHEDEVTSGSGHQDAVLGALHEGVLVRDVGLGQEGVVPLGQVGVGEEADAHQLHAEGVCVADSVSRCETWQLQKRTQ